jgi:two-component system LytT family response regulator
LPHTIDDFRGLGTIEIVEDEPLGRDLLRSCVSDHADVELIGEAINGRDGLLLIEGLRPDLVLLDIRMPEISGISMARSISYNPAIVFVTAFDAHAVTAFELGAFDYLLKPILPERFAAALNRVRERSVINNAESQQLGTALRLGTVLEAGHLQHFFVRRAGDLILIHTANVIRLQAEDDYTAIFTEGRCDLVHIALRAVLERLDPARFRRVHRSHVVNLAHVRSTVSDGRRLKLVMMDGSVVEASRAGSQNLREQAL